MQRKTKKNIVLVLLLITAGAAAIGYYLYNKKHFSVESTTASTVIAAITLHQTFVTDSVLAKNKFIGDEVNHKVIQVSGEVAEIKKDLQGNTIILLKTSTDGAFINCAMEGRAENINAGSKIAIKGICTGYNFDADMGIPGDVILTRCFIAK
jgi:ABC-type glycerol-3-phosphate transport system substrate-binding protein